MARGDGAFGDGAGEGFVAAKLLHHLLSHSLLLSSPRGAPQLALQPPLHAVLLMADLWRASSAASKLLSSNIPGS